VVICLERGADLHVAQLMPLPLIVSCFSKIQIGFTFQVPAHPGSPGQRAVKRACVCVTYLLMFAERPQGVRDGDVYTNLEPERLQFGVVMRGELMRLQQTVEFAVLSASERDDRPRLEHALRVLDLLAGRQRPEEPGQSVHVARAL